MSTLEHHRIEAGKAPTGRPWRQTLAHVAFGVVVFVVSAVVLMSGFAQLTYTIFRKDCSIDSPHPLAIFGEVGCEMENLQRAVPGAIIGFVAAIVVTSLAVRWIRRGDVSHPESINR